MLPGEHRYGGEGSRARKSGEGPMGGSISQILQGSSGGVGCISGLSQPEARWLGLHTLAPKEDVNFSLPVPTGKKAPELRGSPLMRAAGAPTPRHLGRHTETVQRDLGRAQPPPLLPAGLDAE